ncbi:MAG TPA: toprim domain-containing protein [Ktedonobacteraceae bacterium]|nr:toprim domain-containing protein [Ktedonobacteraceae bacterium]
MLTIHTQRGKRIEIILQSELCDPVHVGEYVRAYCHLHGSDHQRSLSINKANGWGHCFNAACDVTVLVAEWNRETAQRLIRMHYQGLSPESSETYHPPNENKKKLPFVYQPVLLHAPRTVPKWQRDELAWLLSLEQQMRAALKQSARARAYLRERGIPLEVAIDTGVCYLPAEIMNRPELRGQRRILQRWTDRMLFPLVSPYGKGFIGRSLWQWKPGMDENAHKELLDKPGRPRRWIKTNPAGWFGTDLEQFPRSIVLVEGAFDRLALIAAGFPARDIVALAGTAAQVDWFPSQLYIVTLALDNDAGGEEATRRLAEQFEEASITVKICSQQENPGGKDWNERWRQSGSACLTPLLALYETENEEYTVIRPFTYLPSRKAFEIGSQSPRSVNQV